MATGCIVEAACLAGFAVAGQIRLGPVDWVDGEDHHWASRRDLRAVVRSLALLEGSCRRVFAVRWEEDVSPCLKVLWERWLA